MTYKFLKNQVLISVAIVILAAALGLVFNALRPGSMPLFQNWGQELAKETREKLSGNTSAIDFEQMKTLYQKPGVIVLDARPKDFFEMEHIPGAQSLPAGVSEDRLTDALKDVPKDGPIIIYCEGGACHDSLDLAAKVTQAGWTNVAVYFGGIMEWMDMNMPMEGEGF